MDKKIKLIIIDLYGVLTTGSYRNICGWLAKKYGLDPDYVYSIVYHKYFNRAAVGEISERASFVEALKELSMKENWREVRKRHLSYLILDRRIFRLALNWQKQGYKILFLSKNVPSQFNDLIKRYKLKKYFKNIINTYDLGLPKASRKTIEYVLNKFKVKPKEVIFIDDQDFNLPEARKMGVKTILYRSLTGLKKLPEL
jgi:FMN phosphatase YigB (HAD superfamily)